MTAHPTDDVQDLELGDEPYESADDEDFQLDDVHSDLSSASEGEEATGPVKKKRKTEAKEEDGEDFDSGDEATIQKAKDKKRRGKKAKAKGAAEDDDEDFDEEGGEGGFVRTRAMKMRMQEERKPLAKIDGATVDVDSLWEMMNSGDTDSGLLPSQNGNEEPSADVDEGKVAEGEEKVEPDQKQQTQYPDEFVKIKRTYKFAGEMNTEEKIVPKDSAEAKIFMASEGDADTLTAADVEDASNAKAVKLRRPLRKLSRFDPNPTGSIQRSWEKQPTTVSAEAENARGPKINTVEKSRLDWAAYVDRAGIKDELKVHSKAKEGYLGRMDFLDRVGAKQEEERRNVRLRGL